MKISKRLVIMSIFAVLALPLVGAVDASAQNVLVNGDFETGDLTGWEVAGETPTPPSPLRHGQWPLACPECTMPIMANYARPLA